MYTPRAFALEDLPELHQLIQHTRLAQLVTFGEQGLQASHLPLLLNPNEGPNGTLYGHLAKANPQWRDLQNGSDALVIFAGAEAYISPSFYPAKAEHGKVVPTWNYIAVHAYGTPEVFSDAERLLKVVTASALPLRPSMISEIITGRPTSRVAMTYTSRKLAPPFSPVR